MKTEIVNAIESCQLIIKHSFPRPLMALEYERVKSIKIRDMLSNSEIKYINGITKEEVTIKEFIYRLNPN